MASIPLPHVSTRGLGLNEPSSPEMQIGLPKREELGDRGKKESGPDPPIGRIQPRHRCQNWSPY